MKCQYCDSQVKKIPDDRICPNCGALFPDDSSAEICLEDYYIRYRPNRIKAAMALQRDTGMGAIKASMLINQVFDEHAEFLKRSLLFRKKQ